MVVARSAQAVSALEFVEFSRVNAETIPFIIDDRPIWSTTLWVGYLLRHWLGVELRLLSPASKER